MNNSGGNSVNKINGKSKKVIISAAVVCGVLIITAGVFVIKTMFFSDSKKPVNVIDTNQTATADNKPATTDNKNTIGNVFNLKTAKVGEKYGEMIVSNVINDKNDGEGVTTTVTFGGEVEITGNYRSEYAGMYGEYITLILDEESRRKVPAESIIIDPIGPKNGKAVDLFGKTGTTGSFNLIISDFEVTNQIEYYGRTAELEKVIKIKKDEISKWVTDDMLKHSGIKSIAYNGKNKYVAVGNNGIIKTSEDLIHWDNCASPALYDLCDVIWAKGKFITVEGKLTDSIPANIYVSDDGEKWTRVYSGKSFNNGSFACNGDIIVFVSETTVLTSTDGLNWVERNDDKLEYVGKIIYDGKRFIAYSPGKVFASKDGMNWSLLTDSIGLGMKSLDNKYLNVDEILWNGNEYVGIGSISGDKAIMISSKDGVLWQDKICASNFVPSSMSWNGKQYVVVGCVRDDIEGSSIRTSQDGINWTQRGVTAEMKIAFNDVIWDGSQFIAVGENRSVNEDKNSHAATIFTSSDGVDWIKRN